jgi:hypothetical protein
MVCYSNPKLPYELSKQKERPTWRMWPFWGQRMLIYGVCVVNLKASDRLEDVGGTGEIILKMIFKK